MLYVNFYQTKDQQTILKDLKINFGAACMKKVGSMKPLGGYFDNNLDFKEHSSSVSTKFTQFNHIICYDRSLKNDIYFSFTQSRVVLNHF